MKNFKENIRASEAKYFCVVSIWHDRYFYKTLTLQEIETYKNNGYKVNIQALRILR